MLLLDAAQTAQVLACKPLLAAGDVTINRESPVSAFEWKLAVVADASHCATRSGMFEIDFISIQEYSPVELQFTGRFQWKEGQLRFLSNFRRMKR